MIYDINDKLKALVALLPLYIIYPVFTVLFGMENISKNQLYLNKVSLVILAIYSFVSFFFFIKLRAAKKHSFIEYIISEVILPLNISLWIFLITLSLLVNSDKDVVLNKAITLFLIVCFLAVIEFFIGIKKKIEVEVLTNKDKFNLQSGMINIKKTSSVTKSKVNIKGLLFLCAAIGMVLSNFDAKILHSYFKFIPEQWDLYLAGSVGSYIFFSFVIDRVYQLVFIRKKTGKNMGLMIT